MRKIFFFHSRSYFLLFILLCDLFYQNSIHFQYIKDNSFPTILFLELLKAFSYEILIFFSIFQNGLSFRNIKGKILSPIISLYCTERTRSSKLVCQEVYYFVLFFQNCHIFQILMKIFLFSAQLFSVPLVCALSTGLCRFFFFKITLVSKHNTFFLIKLFLFSKPNHFFRFAPLVCTFSVALCLFFQNDNSKDNSFFLQSSHFVF